MGGDHGDHGHHGLGPKAKIPDYTVFKVEDCPELVRYQQKLELAGLKDPWIRNEAWRYNPKEFGTKTERALMTFRGLKWGILGALIAVGIDKALSSGDKDHHGHH